MSFLVPIHQKHVVVVEIVYFRLDQSGQLPDRPALPTAMPVAWLKKSKIETFILTSPK